MYAAIARELVARRVLDIGCGTGAFALLLADCGLEVTGVDPALGSLDVARAKPGAERVHWIHGETTALPRKQVDLATMTGNVAQAIFDPPDWDRTLKDGYDGLGLSIAKQIFQDHHGELRLTSVEGEGATVVMDLPMFGQEPRSAPQPQSSTRRDEGKRV